jgi:putative FmdB family regulatory protein
MPIYEYACRECGARFEKLIRRSSDSDALLCPECGASTVDQQLSTFAAHAGGRTRESLPMCPSGGVCPTPGKCGLPQ